jgi:hypothetical protein
MGNGSIREDMGLFRFSVYFEGKDGSTVSKGIGDPNAGRQASPVLGTFTLTMP